MKREEMEKEIMEWIREVADGERISMEMDLMDDIGLSSIDVIDLVTKCEAAFRVKITSRDLRRIYTPGDLADLIESRQ